MSVEAIQIDALWSGINNPTNGKSYSGAIVATFASGTSTPKAVWEDKEKTLPSSIGKSQFVLDSNGQAFVFGDGKYKINIYAPTDTGLTSPLITIDGAEYITSSQILSLSNNYNNDLAAAVAAIGSDVVTLTISEKPNDLTGNLTVPSNITLDWKSGAALGGAFTLTLNGGVIAGPYKIFEDELSVAGAIKVDVNYPEWHGDDVQSAINTTSTNIIPGTHTTAGLNIPEVMIIGNGKKSIISSTGSALGGDWKIIDDKVSIKDLTLTGDADQGIFPSVGVKDFSLRDVKINQLSGSLSGHGIQLNTENVERWTIVGCYFDCGGYGLLINDGADNGQDVIVSSSIIESEKSDAIAQNNPTSTFQNLIASSNIVEAVIGTGDAGFSFSIANGKNNILLGNISRESNQESVHMEDGQERTIISSNVMDEAGKDGVRILKGGAGGGLGKPVVVTANQLHGKTGNTDKGIWTVFDSDGTISGVPIISNIIERFGTGIDVGRGRQIVDNNTIIDATSGIVSDQGIQVGTNFMSSVATWVSATGNSVFGKIISDEVPTTILAKTGPATVMGNILQGFTFPGLTFTHGGTGDESFDLFAAGTRMAGKLTVTGNSGSANYFMKTSDITWNGTTLSETGSVIHNIGLIGSTISYGVAAGNVQITFNSLVGISITSVKVIFDGIYYVD